MSDHHLDNTEPPRLAELLALDPAAGRAWRAEELAAILRHQLDAELEFDPCDLSEETWSQLGLVPAGDAGRDAGRVRFAITFGELLRHPRPPLQLLEYAKRYTKACKGNPDGPMPAEVATVLYFAYILIARIRCGTLISTLDDAALIAGIRWALGQTWLSDDTRGVLTTAAEDLAS